MFLKTAMVVTVSLVIVGIGFTIGATYQSKGEICAREDSLTFDKVDQRILMICELIGEISYAPKGRKEGDGSQVGTGQVGTGIEQSTDSTCALEQNQMLQKLEERVSKNETEITRLWGVELGTEGLYLENERKNTVRQTPLQ